MGEIPAIVFGGGINGLGVVRNLGRNGISVDCVVDGKDPAMYSKFCRRHFVVPHIQESRSTLMRFLAKIEGGYRDYAVLFSTSDLYSLHLSYLKDELERNYYVSLPSYEVVRTLAYKREFYRSLSKCSVSHPITHFPESAEHVKKMSKEMEYPVFVKPSNSQIFSNKFQKKGFIANSRGDLMEYYLLTAKHDIDVVFQEVIPGLAADNVFGVEGYFDGNHNPRASFAHCRLRGWPPVFGNTCLRQSISISEIADLHVTTQNYLHQLGYTGLMEAEWKRDPRDNTFKLLEINPRQSMQNSLPSRCGINLILVAYLDSIGEDFSCANDYREGIRWIDLLSDLRSAVATNTQILDWIASLRKVKEWSFFAADDSRPWIMSSLKLVRGILRSDIRLGGIQQVDLSLDLSRKICLQKSS